MERNMLARQIIDTCLEMTRLGLNQGTAGNVSVRYQGGMLITPTGIPYEKLTESHIVYIDADGQHEEGKLPSSEWRFHMAWRHTRRVRMPMRLSITMLSTVRPLQYSTVLSRLFIT